MKKGLFGAFAVVFAICLVVFCVSCKKKSSGNASSGSAVRAALLTDASGIDDKSFNASAWKGMERFYSDKSLAGKDYTYVVSQTQDQYVPSIRQATDDGYSLVICSGFTWFDSLLKVAKDNPKQKYMLIDSCGIGFDNVTETMFAEEQGSYLVGVIAAKQAIEDGVSNPKFGFVGGVPSATITKFEMGYVQGIKSVLPNAEIVDYYANDWGAPELGKAQAKNWYDGGVYCIFAAAGGTGIGVIAQAKECRVAGKNVWAIGVDSDQFADGVYNAAGDSAVLTSMLKKVENATYQVLSEMKENKWVSGTREFGLEGDFVGYSQANPKLSKNAAAAADAARNDILSGKVSVEKTYAGAKARNLVPGNLRAIDD